MGLSCRRRQRKTDPTEVMKRALMPARPRRALAGRQAQALQPIWIECEKAKQASEAKLAFHCVAGGFILVRSAMPLIGDTETCPIVRHFREDDGLWPHRALSSPR